MNDTNPEPRVKNLFDPRENDLVTFVDILKRWRNLHPSNGRRILKEMGVQPVRLTNKTLLYRVDELLAAEEAARNKLPALRGFFKNRRAEHTAKPTAKKRKELAAK